MLPPSGGGGAEAPHAIPLFGFQHPQAKATRALFFHVPDMEGPKLPPVMAKTR